MLHSVVCYGYPQWHTETRARTFSALRAGGVGTCCFPQPWVPVHMCVILLAGRGVSGSLELREGFGSGERVEYVHVCM